MASPTLVQLPKAGRVTRRPQHQFHIKQNPWAIQPFLIAPVLPGETLTNLLLQSRAITDPITNRVMGWWLEHYVFYVKLRDLNDRDKFTEMALDLDWDPAAQGVESAADVRYYHSFTGINWAKLCLQRVVEEYFRDEGEAWDIQVIDTMPVASVQNNSWLDSLIQNADYIVEDLDVDLNADATIMASEVEEAMRTYQFLQMNDLATMSFEDYLKAHGVRRPLTEDHKPELIRYSRDWQYPSSSVDADTGSVNSVVSWSVAERADKKRFFPEPGFIFGCSVCRPKTYIKHQTGSGTWMMDNALSWLPTMLDNDPRSSYREIVEGTGPLPFLSDSSGAPGSYWADVRDLLVHGDQFFNHIYTEADYNAVQLPNNTSAEKRYVTATSDYEDLFVGVSPDAEIEQDGVVSLSIQGRQVDTTPTSGMNVRLG